jgi:hypothetical protein
MKKFKVNAVERRQYNEVVIEAETEEEAENKFYEMFDNDELPETEECAIEEIEIEETN